MSFIGSTQDEVGKTLDRVDLEVAISGMCYEEQQLKAQEHPLPSPTPDH